MRCTLKDIERVMRIIDMHYQDSPLDLRKIFSFLLVRLDWHVVMPSENTMFLMEPLGEGSWSVHVATTRHNPEITRDSAKAAKWVFENIPDCRELVCIPPGNQREVRLYARRLCRILGGKWDDNDNVCRIRRV